MLHSAAAAMNFCASSSAAVVVTVWPSGTGQLREVRDWLSGAGAKICYESPVALATDTSELLTIMALYNGEDWLQSNCWYMEQPLPTGPPQGPWAGAKWKRALCFRNDASRHPHAIVVDVSDATSSLWRSKYSIRHALATASGNPGNSCIHLTDEQDASTLAAYRRGDRAPGAGGMACDDSYAYACARALFHPESVAYLNSADMDAAAFRETWTRYTNWLQEPPMAADAMNGDADLPPFFLQ